MSPVRTPATRLFLFWTKEILIVTKLGPPGPVPACGFSTDKLGYGGRCRLAGSAVTVTFPVSLAARLP